ncbi:cupin domain-containing protein [Polyangium aurulentum]|uniref:cupin domain-containing protein n=1 Tax=Polyangium aurulentum TaxID=2567896 RepID=UPI0010AE6A40|nr:cupin domain-containing protein [Polyangium aurulentum]UQA56805.1 cupin domain-containing protein [Polyangium aurulentum]
MREGLIIGDLEDPSVVHGVHGTEGLSKWKCLARRAGLFGAWEAVEWAWLPPGGVSGEHVHTRTEEVYFILSGRGEMSLNGQPRAVGPGDLVLTGLGTKHGLRNVGEHGLGWLVIELLGPATAATLRGASAPADRIAGQATERKGEGGMAMIVNLLETPEVDPSAVFTGPLRKIGLVHLGPSQRAELCADGAEHALFTLGGSGEAASGEARVPLKYGVAVTLPLGAALEIDAGPDGLDYFLASLEVPSGGGG